MTLHAWLAEQTAAVNAGDVDPASLADELEDLLRRDPAALQDAAVTRFRAQVAWAVVPGPVPAHRFSAMEEPGAHHMSFSADGARLVAAYVRHVVAIDVATGGVLATCAYDDGRVPCQVQVERGGDAVWIVVGEPGRGFHDEPEGRAWERRSLPALALEANGENGRKVLAIRDDGARLESTRELYLVEGEHDRVIGAGDAEAAVFSPSGAYAAVQDYSMSPAIRGFDLVEGKQIEAFSFPYGLRLGNTIYRERVEIAELVAALPYDITHRHGWHGLMISDVGLARDGRHLVIASERAGVEIWDLPARKLVRKLWSAHAKRLALSPDGALVAVAVGDAIRIAGVAAPRRPAVPWPAVERPRATASGDPAEHRARAAQLVDAAAIDPLAALAELAALRAGTRELRDDLELLRRLHRTIAPFAIPVAAEVRFARTLEVDDGARLGGLCFDATDTHLWYSSDERVVAFDIVAGRIARTLPAHGMRLAAIGDDDRLLLMWQQFQIPQPIGPPIREYEIALVDTTSEARVQLPQRYRWAAIHPHRPLVALLEWRSITLYDATSRRVVRRVDHERIIGECRFIARGALLVVRTYDGALVFATDTGELLTDFNRGAHLGGLAGGTFGRDGRAFAFRTDTATAQLATLCDGLAFTRPGLNVHHLGATAAIGVIPPSWRQLVVTDPRRLAPLHEPIDLGDWDLLAVAHDEGLFLLQREHRLELWTIEYTWSFLEDVLDDHARTIADAERGLAAWLDAWRDLRRLSRRPGLGSEALVRVATARDTLRDHLRDLGLRVDHEARRLQIVAGGGDLLSAARPIDSAGGLPIALSVALVDPDLARQR